MAPKTRSPSTTIKLSVETRDRIRDLGGDTYEDTIVEALGRKATELPAR